MMKRVLAIVGASILLVSACQDTGDREPPASNASEGGTTATWQLLSENLDAESTALKIGVMRVECAGGETGTVLPPTITYSDEQIVIEALVATLPDGAYTCQSNDVVPLEITLEQPIGDRELIDGICQPAGGNCTDGGVRWPLP